MLRRWLVDEGAGKTTIATHGSGYRIRVDPGDVDAQAFVAQVDSALRLAAQGRTAPAADQLRQALRLWHGPALAGCGGRLIEASAARLDEQRLTALEQCLDLELQLGRHDEIMVLGELVAAHPVRERLVGQLMLALHRAGRRTEALDAYRRLRAHLAEDLGLDPGLPLQGLHTAILRNETDPPDEAGSPATPAVPPGVDGAWVVPRQLPAAVRYFVGRSSELHELTRLMKQTAGARGTVVISAIAGTAGVGKTALAVHWAHRVATGSRTGSCTSTCAGSIPTTPMDPADAVRGFLDALGVPAERIPVDLDAQARLYRSLLAGRSGAGGVGQRPRRRAGAAVAARQRHAAWRW